MNVLILGKRRNELFRLFLRRLFGKVVAEGTDARLLARLDLVADIHLRSRVVSDEYDRKPDLLPYFSSNACVRALSSARISAAMTFPSMSFIG